MKELSNGTKIIGIDHGYGNIKTASTVTPTGICRHDTRPIFENNILEYNGAFYTIGEGHKEFIADKSDDEDYYLLTLMAIARELNQYGIREANVHIAAGLPLTWVKQQRKSFKEYLLINDTDDFKFNGKEYHITFVGCSVYPQGYAAVIDHIKDFTGMNILADIGNGTMNILYINNKKPVEAKSWTEKLGVNQCMIAAKNAVMDNFGVKIDDAIVEQFLRFGKTDISRKYIDCLQTVAVEYTNDIFNALSRYEYNSDLMRLYIVGGGGCLIKNFGRYDKDRVCIIDDICATAKGYELIAYKQCTKVR